jgi:Holliday junction resolvase
MMKESDFSKKFITKMQEKFPYMWFMKIHGHEMQQRDIPDYIFTINGFFLAIEFKIQRDGRISVTPGQLRELNKIKDSKSISLIVAYDEIYNRILIRQNRIDYKAIFLTPSNKNVKSGNIRIDWDWEYSNYDNAIELISVALIGV